jgi:hypothetical protein
VLPIDSRSSPNACRTPPSGSAAPGATPVRLASAAAICASSNGPNELALLPNNSCASTSSCGNSGEDDRVIFGAFAVPVISSVARIVPLFALATKSSEGSVSPSPTKLTSPLVKFRVWPARLNVPRRSSNPPLG